MTLVGHTFPRQYRLAHMALAFVAAQFCLCGATSPTPFARLNPDVNGVFVRSSDGSEFAVGGPMGIWIYSSSKMVPVLLYRETHLQSCQRSRCSLRGAPVAVRFGASSVAASYDD